MTEITPIDSSQSVSSIGNIGLLHSKEQYLTFLLKDEVYAVDILRVEEIRGWEVPTLIPNSPNHIKGVINLRGLIVPVSDLRQRFEIGDGSYDSSTVVIILSYQLAGKERQMGIVVVAVSDVVNASEGVMENSSQYSGSQVSQFVTGLLKLEHLVVSVLDIEKLLALNADDQLKQ